jgi:hypothetical protein
MNHAFCWSEESIQISEQFTSFRSTLTSGVVHSAQNRSRPRTSRLVVTMPLALQSKTAATPSKRTCETSPN